jgi:hypothetical protein
MATDVAVIAESTLRFLEGGTEAQTPVSSLRSRGRHTYKERDIDMNGIRKGVLAAVAATSLAVGGVGGAVLYAATAISASAANNPNATLAAAASPAPTTGKFVPNEDPAHEAGESAAREAQENAGQVPTVP